MLPVLISAVLAASSGQQAGCLGRPIGACVSLLRQSYIIDQADIDRVLLQRAEVDINGKLIRGSRYVTLVAIPQNGGIANTISAELDETGDVQWIEFGLRGDPGQARTEAEYDESGLAAPATIVLPREGCPYSSRLAFFRFFENTVKPTISYTQPRIDLSWGAASELSSGHSQAIPICGLLLVYRVISGHSTRLISEHNVDGVMHHATIRFSLP